MARKVLAQDLLGPPLRKADLELVAAANAAEIDACDLPLRGPEKLDMPDADTRLEKSIDQARAIENVENGRLQCGAPGLVVRSGPLLHDTRSHAVSQELARREQASRPRSYDKDRRDRSCVSFRVLGRHRVFLSDFT